jgi:hypothetical protein
LLSRRSSISCASGSGPDRKDPRRASTRARRNVCARRSRPARAAGFCGQLETLEPSHHRQCCQQRQHRQHRLPQHLDRPWKPTTTGAFVKPVSDADDADAADATSARTGNQLYGPPSPNAGSTGFARAGTGLQGRRHGRSPAPAGGRRTPRQRKPSGTIRASTSGWRCGARDLDPQLACVLVVLESRNQQRRVAGGQCHNGARGKAGASTWVAIPAV